MFSLQKPSRNDVNKQLERILAANNSWKKNDNGTADLAKIYRTEKPTHQTPNITCLTCSDSRIAEKGLGATSINQVFSIRNIGNQICTAPGSIEYGVYKLLNYSGLFLVLGHTGCGAIAAAADPPKDINVYDGIKQELNPLIKSQNEEKKKWNEMDESKYSIFINKREKKKSELTDFEILDICSELNVDAQVNIMMKEYQTKYEQIKEKPSEPLLIVGGVMDLHGIYRNSEKGTLQIVNINGETQGYDAINRLLTYK